MNKKEKRPDWFGTVQSFADYIGVSRMQVHRWRQRVSFPTHTSKMFYYSDYKEWVKLILESGRCNLNYKTMKRLRAM